MMKFKASEKYTDIKERREFLESLVRTGRLSKEVKDCFIDNGGLTCPASLNYHGNYQGGLFDHCVAMFDMLEQFCLSTVQFERTQSTGNIAFGHDICKLDNYVEQYSWDEGEPCYKYNDETSLHGHGSKSLIILLQHAKLTDEEVNCILFHMGAYEKDLWKQFDKAIKKYPTVLFTHTADMYASKIMEV